MTNASLAGEALPETIDDWTGHPTNSLAVPRPASEISRRAPWGPRRIVSTFDTVNFRRAR